MPEQGILDDIFAIQHRSCHARAITVQARPELNDRFEKRQIARLKLSSSVYLVLGVHIDLYAARRLEDTLSLVEEYVVIGPARSAKEIAPSVFEGCPFAINLNFNESGEPR